VHKIYYDIPTNFGCVVYFYCHRGGKRTLQIDLIIRCSTLTRKKDNNVNAMQVVFFFWKTIVDTIGKLKLMTEKMEKLQMYVQKKKA
jgi:hypothetical protein